MTNINEETSAPAQPAIAELFTRYLQRQTTAHVAGLGLLDTTAEVVPFEAVPVQPVDPRLAWNEAVAAAEWLGPGDEAKSWPAPLDWPTIVSMHEPAVAIAFCLGNFPQLVRHPHALFQVKELAELRPVLREPLPCPAVVTWAETALREKRFPRALIALGTLRLVREFDRAAHYLHKNRPAVPLEWQPAWANEEAALAWHRGQAEEAVASWQGQPASVPVLFNRSMAALFAGKVKVARSSLAQAVEKIPEESAWHHLGRLYMALAEMHTR